jgi:hypothetical protein
MMIDHVKAGALSASSSQLTDAIEISIRGNAKANKSLRIDFHNLQAYLCGMDVAFDEGTEASDQKAISKCTERLGGAGRSYNQLMKPGHEDQPNTYISSLTKFFHSTSIPSRSTAEM